MVEYVVQKHDTITAIKERFNVTWKQIQRQNPHAVGKLGESGRWFLKEGAGLTFEDEASGTDAATFQDQLKLSSQRLVHTVCSGDTLWGLSKAYGVDVKAIADLNGLENPDLIQVGQSLSIPEIQSSKPEKDTETRQSLSSESTALKAGEENADSPDARSVEKECLDALARDSMPMPLYTGELSIPEYGPTDSISAENAVADGLTLNVVETNAAVASTAPGAPVEVGNEMLHRFQIRSVLIQFGFPSPPTD
ncbi:MAG: LysM peptidoglycan-binding domain-containing protein [Deltaproteobacteria bacterium]|nr:LysM peptidoglycan-binding domain-containing protein [Deltaproteobacteria bacterium]